MATAKHSSPRRREVRRTVPRPGPAWLTWLRRRDVAWCVLWVTLFTVGGGLIVATIGQQPRYYQGQVIAEPIVSRTAFTHVDEEQTILARNEARNAQPPIYTPNIAYLQSLRESLANLIALAEYYDRIGDVPEDQRDPINLTAQGLSALRTYLQQDGGSLARWRSDTENFLQRLFNIQLLTPERYQYDRYGRIQITHHPLADTGTQILPALDFYDLSKRDAIAVRLEREAAQIFPESRDLQRTLVAVAMRPSQPTYQFDAERTEAARQEAYDNQTPVEVVYRPDQVLVQTGEALTATSLELLAREHDAYQQQRSVRNVILTHTGHFGLVLLIGAGLWSYIFAYNYRVVRNPMRGLALTVLLLGSQFMAAGLTQWQPEILYVTAIFPTLMVAMVLAIVYDQRFALAVAAFHTMLIMLSLALPVGFAIVLLTGVGVAVAMLREVRTRAKLVMVGLWSGAAMGLVTLLTSVASRNLDIAGELHRIVMEDTLFAVLTGFGVGIVVQGVLPGIERVFKVTTAMTLKELNDASHPLLQRLAQEASGTYQHSLRIADMAEGAADAIGADGLLCRVGAMYHDIGKINKPMYFIENQGGGPNRHTKLSPAMSLLIIVGHVKDGVEMAREYGLPPVIRHFIESHHGTTLVEYFYHAARKQKEAADEDLPSEFEFRYPGPKPQTREAAIMLLCDSIEAAARSLAEPTPIRLEQLVHTMANKRLMDGQFDECSLTLQELHKIEMSITKTLCAVYHGRIKYPAERKVVEQPAPPQAVAS